MNFSYPKSIKLANLPTPIIKLGKTNENYPNHTIYLKRDDWTGCSISGNKIRKLEFVLAAAIAAGADTVITCGGLQSNHARATALAAASLGLHAHLVLRGQPESIATGNFLLDKLAGSSFTFITPEDYRSRVNEIMTEISEKYRQDGHKAYIIPEGASDALGALGYVRTVEEIARQIKQEDLKIDYIVSAVGSGGTLAGQIIGKKIFRLTAEIVGFNICDDVNFFQNKIMKIIETARERFNLAINFHRSDISIIDGYVGKGYGQNTPEELHFIQQFAHREGIILDPVYTGKAMLGFLKELENGRFEPKRNFLFIHTGGIFEVFAKASEFAKSMMLLI